MSKTLILGNAQTAVAAVEQIRKEDPSSEIALFCPEGSLPYDRSLLPALLARDIKDAQVFMHPEKYYQEQNITLTAREELGRISVKRKHVSTAKKAQISYDRLLLTDTGAVFLPPVKGHQKDGVFNAWQLASTKALIKYLPYADNVVVSVTTLQGLNTACALARHKKEVVVVASGEELLPEVLDEETGALLKQILEGKGLRVMTANSIEEILGDAQVKAVKLKSGKVIACEAVVFDAVTADMRMLSEPVLNTPDEIRLDGCFQPLSMPFEATEFGLGILSGFYVGETRLPEGGREHLRFDGPQNIYKKIFAHGAHLKGAVLFNAPAGLKDKILDAIRQGTSIEGAEEALLD